MSLGVQLLSPRDDVIHVYVKLHVESSLLRVLSKVSGVALRFGVIFKGTVETSLITVSFASSDTGLGF